MGIIYGALTSFFTAGLVYLFFKFVFKRYEVNSMCHDICNVIVVFLGTLDGSIVVSIFIA